MEHSGQKSRKKLYARTVKNMRFPREKQGQLATPCKTGSLVLSCSRYCDLQVIWRVDFDWLTRWKSPVRVWRRPFQSPVDTSCQRGFAFDWISTYVRWFGTFDFGRLLLHCRGLTAVCTVCRNLVQTLVQTTKRPNRRFPSPSQGRLRPSERGPAELTSRRPRPTVLGRCATAGRPNGRPVRVANAARRAR